MPNYNYHSSQCQKPTKICGIFTHAFARNKSRKAFLGAGGVWNISSMLITKLECELKLWSSQGHNESILFGCYIVYTILYAFQFDR